MSVLVEPRTHLIVVAPHPDDETIGLGGTIHDHLQGGGTVEIIAVTDGEAADDQADGPAQRALAMARDRERTRALASLQAEHVPVHRLRLPDRHVGEHPHELARTLTHRFRDAMRRAESCLVALPWRHDIHPDHEATGRVGIQVAVALGIRHVEIPIWAAYQRAIQPKTDTCRHSISAAGQAAKRAALQAFTSQIEPLPGGRSAILPADFLAFFDRPYEVLLA